MMSIGERSRNPQACELSSDIVLRVSFLVFRQRVSGCIPDSESQGFQERPEITADERRAGWQIPKLVLFSDDQQAACRASNVQVCNAVSK